MSDCSVLSYGGGRQTVAICVAVARGLFPRPDRIIMADTGRENPSTWAYLAAHVRPMLAEVGLAVEIAPRSLATVDLHAKNGDLLLPVYTPTGKLPGWCSGEWKREVVGRYMRASGITPSEIWIGFALDERKRVARMLRSERKETPKRFPLLELMMTTADAVAFVRSHGLPDPPHSSCWMCPNKGNAEWRDIRDNYPAEWEAACQMDEELRADDIEAGHGGVWLHRDRVPLREADLDKPETQEIMRQCGLGMCFV